MKINFPRPYGRGISLIQTSFALHQRCREDYISRPNGRSIKLGRINIFLPSPVTSERPLRLNPFHGGENGRDVLMSLDKVLPQAGLTIHIYPCSASTQNEYIDDGLFEPVINISGYVMNDYLAGVIETLRQAGNNR